MIYFDNAATTFPKPQSVINSVNECIKEYCGNPGRGSHSLARRAAEGVFETREKIATLLGTKAPENVVFTYNATYAINLALKTLIKENCHVITSDIEHNAVIRPLEKLKRTVGISYSIFDSDGDIQRNIEKLIQKDTACIVSTLSSNVTGKPIPLKILSDISIRYGLKLIVDASQYIGYKEIDLTETPCDVLCAPGHKSLYGIQGCGFMLLGDSVLPKPILEGGNGINSLDWAMPDLSPERFETGTLPTPCIAGLSEGISYLSKFTPEEIATHEIALFDRLKYMLMNSTELKAKIYLPEARGAVMLFNMDGISSETVGRHLSERGICVRSGYHCSALGHKALGTDEIGAVRVSFGIFNTLNDTEILIRALKELRESTKADK